MPQRPFPPFVGYGRTDEKTGITLGDDSNSVSFDNSGSDFVVGDLAIVCDGAGTDSEFQFLGAVTGATAGGITTTLYTNSDKGSSAKLWKPTAGFQFAQNFDSPAMRDRNLGVVTQVTKGGIVWSVQTGDPFERLEWRFPQNAHEVFVQFRNFIVDDRAESLDSFTAAYWDFQDIDTDNPNTSIGSAKCVEARYAKSVMQFRETGVGTIQDSIPLFVVDFDAYVDS